MDKPKAQTRLLDASEVAALFRRLKENWRPRPRRFRVKDDADVFRALVACLLSAQSRDVNTAKAKNALFELADTQAVFWRWKTRRSQGQSSQLASTT